MCAFKVGGTVLQTKGGLGRPTNPMFKDTKSPPTAQPLTSGKHTTLITFTHKIPRFGLHVDSHHPEHRSSRWQPKNLLERCLHPLCSRHPRAATDAALSGGGGFLCCQTPRQDTCVSPQFAGWTDLVSKQLPRAFSQAQRSCKSAVGQAGPC